MEGLIKGKEGYEFHSDKRKYDIYEGITIGGNRNYTSDIAFIVDIEETGHINYVGATWGAGDIGDEDSENYIRECVKAYETKQNIPNGIARLEHAKEIVEAYLTTNEEVIREYEENGIQEIEKIKRDIEYLATLIEKAKEIQR